MASMVNTRLATINDAPILAHMNTLFNGVRTPPAQLAAQLVRAQHVETVVVAEIMEYIVGFACLRLVPCALYSTPYAELTELFVDERWRRHGVGHALVAALEDLARVQGANELCVLTGRMNSPAHALYRATGYQEGPIAFRKALIEGRHNASEQSLPNQ